MCIKPMSDEQMRKAIDRHQRNTAEQERNLRSMSDEAINGYVERAGFMFEKKRGGSESVYSLQRNMQMARAELDRRGQPAARRFARWLLRGPK